MEKSLENRSVGLFDEITGNLFDSLTCFLGHPISTLTLLTTLAESIGNASNMQTHNLIHIQQTDVVK